MVRVVDKGELVKLLYADYMFGEGSGFSAHDHDFVGQDFFAQILWLVFRWLGDEPYVEAAFIQIAQDDMVRLIADGKP